MWEHRSGNAPKNEAADSLLDHNLFIVWNDSYNLGIPIIDEQHRGIVTTINSLHFGLRSVYSEHIFAASVHMMYEYTRLHFQIEESFLEKLDYHQAVKHHELHHDLMITLTETGKQALADKDPYAFLDFLKDWWISHICNEDLQYRDYLIS